MYVRLSVCLSFDSFGDGGGACAFAELWRRCCCGGGGGGGSHHEDQNDAADPEKVFQGAGV